MTLYSHAQTQYHEFYTVNYARTASWSTLYCHRSNQSSTALDRIPWSTRASVVCNYRDSLWYWWLLALESMCIHQASLTSSFTKCKRWRFTRLLRKIKSDCLLIRWSMITQVILIWTLSRLALKTLAWFGIPRLRVSTFVGKLKRLGSQIGKFT